MINHIDYTSYKKSVNEDPFYRSRCYLQKNKNMNIVYVFRAHIFFFKLLHNRIKARNLKAPWNVNLKHEVSKGHCVNKWLLFHQLSPCVYTLKYVCTMKRKSNLLVKHRRQLYRKTCVCRSGIWQRPKALRIWGHQNIFRLLCRRASAPSIYHVRLFQPLCEGRLETKNSLKKICFTTVFCQYTW